MPNLQLEGITPAGAGKTKPRLGGFLGSWDHPRRCGENFICRSAGLVIKGSPPQVRGKLTMLLLLTIQNRITPAGAGKTHCTPRPTRSREDHPRRCGENCIVQRSLSAGQGSPPQVRGKPDTPAEETETDRITPAGAGKTRMWQKAAALD